MTKQPLSPRNRFLLLAAPAVIMILACGSVSLEQAASPPQITQAAGAPVASGATPTVPVQPQLEPPAATESSPASLAAAIPEYRRLTLEFPTRMRAGAESDIVRLTLEVDDLGNLTPTAEIEGNTVIGGQIEIPNLYETHLVIAEARLDLAGMEVRPADTISEPLTPGQSVTFYWSIRPDAPGTYRGTVWLHLRFVEKSTGGESRKAVSAQIVEIDAVDFFGLPVSLARTSGVVGSVVGGILGFPFLEDVLRFFIRRLKK